MSIIKPLRLESEETKNQSILFACSRIYDFLENAKLLRLLSSEERDALEPGSSHWGLMPKFTLVKGDYKGEFKVEQLDIDECSRSDFVYSILCNWIADRAYAGDPHFAFGVEFAQEDDTLIYSTPFYYDEEEAKSLLYACAEDLQAWLLKESGCSTVEAATAFFQSRAKQNKSKAAKKQRMQEEMELEDSVFKFLESQGFNPLRQVKSGHLRLDILVPNQLIVELKAGKVSSDDVLQAADYLTSHSMDVLLVGTGLSSSATRGIEAINKLAGENQILFVTRNACLRYLNGVLCKE